MAMPGIGRSTAGAILSISFRDPHPILDGNVKRVLTRLHNIEGWPGQREIEKQLWELAHTYTARERCADYTQAIMDLGATLCTRSKPQCQACPFENVCLSKLRGTTSERPTPKPKTKKPVKELWLIDVRRNSQILLEKRPPSGIWGGLHSLIELDRDYLFEELEDVLERQHGIKVLNIEETGTFEHIFSHYKLIAHTVLAHGTASTSVRESSTNWHNQSDLNKLGLPAPIKKYFTRNKVLP